jgi:hypothetical protein
VSADPLPEGVLASEHLGVRVWWITAAALQEMVDRLALVLGEHLQGSDELHISYHGMQKGWQERAKFRAFGPPERWAELDFEYSALVVLRDCSRCEQPDSA